ncbi:uncharacterized protein DEA37_0009508, partial [Paragonimus westermani]
VLLWTSIYFPCVAAIVRVWCQMPRLDRQIGGFRVFIGGVDPRVGKVDIEREFDRFGPIVDVWVARNPPGFAFIVFKYSEDADRAVRRMDGSRPFGSRLRVEHAVNASKSNGKSNEHYRKSKVLMGSPCCNHAKVDRVLDLVMYAVMTPSDATPVPTDPLLDVQGHRAIKGDIVVAQIHAFAPNHVLMTAKEDDLPLAHHLTVVGKRRKLNHAESGPARPLSDHLVTQVIAKVLTMLVAQSLVQDIQVESPTPVVPRVAVVLLIVTGQSPLRRSGISVVVDQLLEALGLTWSDEIQFTMNGVRAMLGLLSLVLYHAPVVVDLVPIHLPTGITVFPVIVHQHKMCSVVQPIV